MSDNVERLKAELDRLNILGIELVYSEESPDEYEITSGTIESTHLNIAATVNNLQHLQPSATQAEFWQAVIDSHF